MLWVDAVELVRPVQGEEIKKAFFSMSANKAPGPYRFPVEFYKAVWPVIGRDLVAVQSFFLYGMMPKNTNATLLSLIPKTIEAECMSDYRPIACYNVIYKIISKILARRLKATLPLLLSRINALLLRGVSYLRMFCWRQNSSKTTIIKEYLLALPSNLIFPKHLIQSNGISSR